MSEEQYDCQVTSEHYADYFLRSKISWARLVGDAAQAAQLPEQMREHVQSTRTNCQYFEMEEIAIQKPPPSNRQKWSSQDEKAHLIMNALHNTIPLNFEKISQWHTCILSTHEILLLCHLSRCYKEQGKLTQALSIAKYAHRCLESTDANPVCREDLYVFVSLQMIHCLGNCGLYDESNSIALQCLQTAIACQDSMWLSTLLYNIAWNLEQQEHTVQQREGKNWQKVIHCFQEAYAVAILSGDTMGQKRILAHCAVLLNA